MSSSVGVVPHGVPRAGGHGPVVRRRRPSAVTVVMAIAAATLVSAWWLELDPAKLFAVSDGAGRLVGEVLGAAWSPALFYESPATDLPADIEPLLVRVIAAVGRTLMYAVGAVSLVLVVGLGLGFLCSRAWWERDRFDMGRRSVRGRAMPVVHAAARLISAAMRSTHELLWAVLVLVAVGLTPFAAVCALAIPHAGTLAKVFAELVDEAPRDVAAQLRAAGATGLQRFVFGLLPRARADLVAYGFYRFECIVRGAAVLGFFGIETVGKYVRDAFENGHYHEMWTYIDALLVVVLALDAWSGAVRRRIA